MALTDKLFDCVRVLEILSEELFVCDVEIDSETEIDSVNVHEELRDGETEVVVDGEVLKVSERVGDNERVSEADEDKLSDDVIEGVIVLDKLPVPDCESVLEILSDNVEVAERELVAV